MPDDFDTRNRRMIAEMNKDEELRHLSRQWFDRASEYEYSYHFTWLGLPIIQFPQDMVAIQEIIWRIKPDLIIETGVARGGSVIFYASMLQLLAGSGTVIGIDIDIREKNRKAIEKHPLASRIQLIEGSSVDSQVVQEVQAVATTKGNVVVVLDSNHTHEHVLLELELYSPLVTAGSYLVVLDTVVEYMPPRFFPDRPWGRGNNPHTAVVEFLSRSDSFQLDREIEDKLLTSAAPGGFLRRVS